MRGSPGKGPAHSPCGVVPGRGGGGTPGVPGFLASVGRTRAVPRASLQPRLERTQAVASAVRPSARLSLWVYWPSVSLSASVTVCPCWEVVRPRSPVPGARTWPRKFGLLHAEAGEPHRGPERAGPGPVYPRVGGEPALSASQQANITGLSPRGRGNPPASRWAAGSRRSIPAWAGEPELPAPGLAVERVYPRVGGGTVSKPGRMAAPFGLSPRGRGNPYSENIAGPSLSGNPTGPVCQPSGFRFNGT